MNIGRRQEAEGRRVLGSRSGNTEVRIQNPEFRIIGD